MGQRGRVVSFLFRALLLDLPDVLDGLFQSGGHELMHLFRLITFHKVGRPAAASQEIAPIPHARCGPGRSGC